MHILKVETENHPILGNFSLDFRHEDSLYSFNLLIGQNGCGKTQVLELIHDCIAKSFIPWKDDIIRKLYVRFTPGEMEELGINCSEVEFVYSALSRNNWNDILANDIDTGQSIINQLLPHIQEGRLKNIFWQSCRYSPVEINFEYKKIDAIRATDVDAETIEIISGKDLAGKISQLLVDIRNQDAQAALQRERENAGQEIHYEVHEGKYDRFKNAYARLFRGKSLGEVEVSDGAHTIFIETDSGDRFSMEHLSSGEKQIVYRVGYLLSNLRNINSGVVLIDEPELSLHPEWQRKYLTFLEDVFSTENGLGIQFIIATHSPYIIQGADFDATMVWRLSQTVANTIIEENLASNWSIFNTGPTLGEITYKAFEIPNIEFHCDLYNELQWKLEPNGRITDLETTLVNNHGQAKEITWVDTGTGNTKEETLMTYVRNKIHHSDNTDRPDFADEQLQTSIDRMNHLLVELKLLE